MKPIACILLFLISATLHAQVYTLTRIKGGTVKYSGKVAKPYDKLKKDLEIEFSGKNVCAIFLDAANKSWIAEPKQNQLNGKLEQYLHRQEYENSRGDLLRSSDLPAYFGDKTFSIIGKELTLNFSDDVYNQTANSFFIAEYIVNGKTEKVKLTGNGNTLQISKSEIFKLLPENTTNYPINIGWFNGSGSQGQINFIAAFTLQFVLETEVKDDLTPVYEALKQQNASNIRSELINLLKPLYGNFDLSQAEMLLKKWWNL